MAYPTVSAPYGFVPVQLLGGQPFAGAMRTYPIDTAHGTAIYQGDVVYLNSDGNAARVTATDTAVKVLGIFMGCSYTQSATGQKIWSNVCPATPASDTQLLVADDPDLVMKAAVCAAGGTTMGGLTLTDRGQNLCYANVAAGSTVNGTSRMAVSSTSHTTTTFPLKIVSFVEETKNASGSYTEVLVMWNSGIHYQRGGAGAVV